MTHEAGLEIRRGGRKIGPVGLVVRSGPAALLLDCGAEGRGNSTWIDDIGDLAGVWVSHAHLDHSGGLPDVWEGRPLLDVAASGTTAELTEVLLREGAGVSPGLAADIRRGLDPVAAGETVEFVEGRGRDGIRFVARPLRAGHIPGARMLTLEVPLERGRNPETHRLVYSGDVCLHDQPVTSGASRSVLEDRAVDTLVLEGILATNEAADTVDYDDQLVEFRRTCREAEGAVLVAGRAAGDGLELAAELAGAGEEVWLHDSMEAVRDVVGARRRLPALPTAPTSELSARLEEGGTVVAPGDQLDASTPANELAGSLVARPEGTVVVVNRAYDGTPAGALLAADAGEQVSALASKPVKRARVRHLELPDHAPRSDLVALVRSVDPERLVLVHGRGPQLEALGRAVREAGFEGSVDIPADGERIALD